MQYVVGIPSTFAFDDILLLPKFSDIEHRSECNVETSIGLSVKLQIPIIASCMDTICDSKMAIAIGNLGGLGVIHRYMSNEDQIADVQITRNSLKDKHVAAAIGVKDIQHARDLASAGCDVIVVDVAHGHHKLVGEFVSKMVAEELFPTVIAGNVCTAEGTKFLVDAGADAIRVGIGSGSICRTREVTGHGAPLLSSLRECKSAVGDSASIIADGGIRSSGDVVKSLAFGADAAMLGSMIAGCDETPGRETLGLVSIPHMKAYRGMASRTAQEDFYEMDIVAPEGVTTEVSVKGPVAKVVNQIIGGLRSGMSYSGVRTIRELRQTTFQYITNAGRIESHLGSYSSIG